MRGGRGPPSNRPEPISPPHLRKTHHPRHRRRAFLCMSYRPIRHSPTPRRRSLPPTYRLSFSRRHSVLRLINAGTSDGRRFSAAPQAKDRAAWRLVQTAVPSLTDKAAQDGDQLLVAHQGSRNPLLSRSYRSPELSRVVRDTPRRACGSLLIHFRTLAPPSRATLAPSSYYTQSPHTLHSHLYP